MKTVSIYKQQLTSALLCLSIATLLAFQVADAAHLHAQEPSHAEESLADCLQCQANQSAAALVDSSPLQGLRAFAVQVASHYQSIAQQSRHNQFAPRGPPALT